MFMFVIFLFSSLSVYIYIYIYIYTHAYIISVQTTYNLGVHLYLKVRDYKQVTAYSIGYRVSDTLIDLSSAK